MPSAQELFDLSGQVAVVTGAGSGLGVIFSEALAEAGADVVCADINMDGAKQTAAQIEAMGRHAVAVAVDVTDEAAVERMVGTAAQQLGRLDILVNNAGVGSGGLTEELSLAAWQHVVDVNLTGVFLGAREAARVMIPGGGGRIINIASILGTVAYKTAPVAAYTATKGAVVNLTRDLAAHWAKHNIRVNAIGPGFFPSAMTETALHNTETRHGLEQLTPMGRIGRPDDLKGPIVFLASSASSYVTGQTLYVDGGWTLW